MMSEHSARTDVEGVPGHSPPSARPGRWRALVRLTIDRLERAPGPAGADGAIAPAPDATAPTAAALRPRQPRRRAGRALVLAAALLVLLVGAVPAMAQSPARCRFV